MSKKLSNTSKFLSYVLRHRPDAIGLTIDKEGWTDIASLIANSAPAGKLLDRDLIRTIVVKDDKRRFEISEDSLNIRAVQGHSITRVDISYAVKIPPKFLYHGTTTSFLKSIRKDGLMPRSRQYVHLSDDMKTATAVGQRHGHPVVLTVNASTMYKQGYNFFQANNGVWLTRIVPVQFIAE